MQCIVCGTPINHPKPSQNLCIVCQYEKQRIAKKKSRVKKKEKTLKVCRCCSKEFWSEYKVEKFCSSDCKNHRIDRKGNKDWLEGKEKQTALHKKMVKDSFNKFTVFPS